MLFLLLLLIVNQTFYHRYQKIFMNNFIVTPSLSSNLCSSGEQMLNIVHCSFVCIIKFSIIIDTFTLKSKIFQRILDFYTGRG